jgi:uncharacterized membrane protein YecN with MAPEG domain
MTPRRTVAWLFAALLALLPVLVQAQENDPVTDSVVRDREFGVTARHFGLERRVSMYQWRAKGTGYERVWSEAPIDATGYTPGHENPDFPLRGRRWLAERVTLDDKPLDRSVIEQLGQWRTFRPNFSALPGNLAATFQPEGDGLGSAENPLDPQVGDLRIGWRELTLPPLQGRVELSRGTWFPIAGDPISDPVVAPVDLKVALRAANITWPKTTLLFAALHAFLLLGLSVQVMRWRLRARIGLGMGGHADLGRWVRVHGNFTEYVPLTLLLMALLELGGFPRQWLFAGGCVLLLGRVLHAVGLARNEGTSFGRATGTALTLIVLTCAAFAALWYSMQ